MTSADTRTTAPGRVRVLARLGVVGGLLGALQALVLTLWPAQVGPDRFSFPQTPDAAAVTQVTFAVQHLLLIAGLLALLGVPQGRLLRAGLWVATAGIALLTVVELVAIAAVAEPAGSPLVGTVENLYGLPTIVTGLGLVVAGVGVLRGGALPGPRWLLLGTGLFVFVGLVPALMGPFVVARIAIGVWMLLFAWLFTAPARS